MIDKTKIRDSAKKIEKSIYLYPIIIVLFAFILISIVIYVSIEDLKKLQMKNVLDNLIVKAKNLSKIELENLTKKINATKKIDKQKLIAEVSKLKYLQNGHFWIYDIADNKLINEVNNNETITKILKTKPINQIDGEYIYYKTYQSDSSDMLQRISYVRYIKNLNWYIGTTIYVENINNYILEEKKNFKSAFIHVYLNMGMLFLIIWAFVFAVALKLFGNINKEFNQFSKSLLNINDELEEKVENRTKELNELNLTLEEKVKEETEKNRLQEIKLLEQAKFVQMGELIGNIAHQWRQPLSVISTISTGLKMKLEYGVEVKSEEIIDNLSILSDTTKELSNTIDYFRDFIKSGKEKSIVNIQENVENTIKLVSDSMANNDISIYCQYDFEQKQKVFITPSEFSQVLLNIFENSKDAFFNKDIKEKWIKIDIIEYNQKVSIVIEDNAGGIDENIISKIFDPYFTTKHQSQGTGMGLYSSKTTIEKLFGGELTVQNTNNGVKFTIILPLAN